MIQPGEIARLAHRLGLGDKTIEKDYVLAWSLLAIAESPLRNRLAFKGGTALKKVYVPDYRFSEDLDFTLLDDISNNVLTRKQEAFRRLWEPRLHGQMPDLQHLDAVIRETNRWLRQTGLVTG